MKNKIKIQWISAITLLALGLAAGCHSQDRQITRNYSMRPVNVPVVEQVDVPGASEDLPAGSPAAELSEEFVVQEALAPEEFSPGVASIAELVHSGISESLLFTFIENSGTQYSVSSEEVIYLRDIGTPEPVIAMLIEVSIPVAEAQSESPALAMAESGQPAEISEEVSPVEHFDQGTSIGPPAAGPATTVVEHHHYFHDALSPYGSWIYLPEYGNVWRPTAAVVDINWRPYHDNGRWVYSDYGWYWHSYYSWGWAPFHYGRWYSSPAYGWVWVPGPTWGPAWVSWRYSSSYYGWAPLPPSAVYSVGVGFTYHGARVGISFGWGLSQSAYCFIDRGYIGHHRPWQHTRPRNEITKIYNDTTIINNYVVNSNNRTIINRGVNYDEAVRGARNEIPRVSIQDAGTSNVRTGRAETLDLKGNRVVAYRPNVTATTQRSASSATSGRAETERQSREIASPALRRTGEVSRDATSRRTQGPSRTPASTDSRTLVRVATSEERSQQSANVASRPARPSVSSASSTTTSRGPAERALRPAPNVSSRPDASTSRESAQRSAETVRQAPAASGRTVSAPARSVSESREAAPAQRTVVRSSNERTTPAPSRNTTTRSVISDRSVSAPASRSVVNSSVGHYSQPGPTIIRSVRTQESRPANPVTQRSSVPAYQSPSPSRSVNQTRSISTPTVRSQPQVISRPPTSQPAPRVSAPSLAAPSTRSSVTVSSPSPTVRASSPERSAPASRSSAISIGGTPSGRTATSPAPSRSPSSR